MSRNFCKVCGSEKDVSFYLEKGCQSLCSFCAYTTPNKITRSEFNKLYWGDNWMEVPASTRREFYDDYRTSELDYNEYRLQTVEETE